MTNPLRDPRDRRLPRLPEPCTLVVFGVTGDLARNKLLPALYDLANAGLLPPEFALVGHGRRDWTDEEFAGQVRDHARSGARTAWREDVWRRLAATLRFVRGASFDDPAGYEGVADLLRERTAAGIANAAFYLSIPPDDFPAVLRGIGAAGLGTAPAGAWRRVVVEKPFGHDLASARELHTVVDAVFARDAIFRIDHYLGKETVQNILALRFANTLFEPVWNYRYVDSVQLTMAEDGGIGTRAQFFDATGTTRDVVQNHLLQLLALVAMEEPVSFDPDSVRTEKLKVLRAIRLPEDVGRHAIRGQYQQGWCAGQRVRGYLQEDGVASDSRTETYAAIRFGVETRRWGTVPFYVRAGKRLPRRVTEIAVLFRRAPHLPFEATDTVELGQNQVIIRVQPDEGVTLKFGSKVPGTRMEVRDVAMDFLYGAAFTESSPEAYERLILDALLGDSTLFPDDAEIEASWSLIDPLEEVWAESRPATYRAGQWGPDEAEQMVAAEGRHWRRP